MMLLLCSFGLDCHCLPGGKKELTNNVPRATDLATLCPSFQGNLRALGGEVTVGNSPSVIDRFYKGAISNVEVEKFWEIGAES